MRLRTVPPDILCGCGVVCGRLRRHALDRPLGTLHPAPWLVFPAVLFFLSRKAPGELPDVHLHEEWRPNAPTPSGALGPVSVDVLFS